MFAANLGNNLSEHQLLKKFGKKKNLAWSHYYLLRYKLESWRERATSYPVISKLCMIGFREDLPNSHKNVFIFR